jgi:Flp pilus assembly protein TadD
LYERAVAAAPHVADIHFNFANLLAATDDEGAIAVYQRAIELRPTFSDAYIALGAELHKRRKFDEAAACFREAVELAPQDARGHFNLGRCLMDLGRPGNAIAFLEKTTELEPQNADAHQHLATLYVDAGRMEEAVLHGRHAVAASGRPEHYSALGETLRRAGRHTEALAAHEAAIAQAPDDLMVLHNYGASLHGAGQLSKAEEIFRHLIAKGRRPRQILYRLGKSLRASRSV